LIVNFAQKPFFEDILPSGRHGRFIRNFKYMPQITFIGNDGRSVTVTAKVGHSLMEVAVDNDIAGMVAECGGACACATCHTYIDAAWIERMPPMQEMEDAMLDSAMDRRDNSRLSCQIEVSDALDGLVITVADNAA
jgi:2Fe-2S ferredoxin